VPLLQEVLPHLVARQRSLLVLHTTNLGVLHLLHVEPHQLLAQGRDGHPRDQPPDPGQDVADARLKRRRQPSLGPGPVVGPRLAVPRLPLPATAANHTPPVERRLDHKAPVFDLGGEGDAAGLFLDHCQARQLRARIDLDPVLVNDRVLDCTVLEDDREREPLEHGGTPGIEQLPRPSRIAGVQRLPVLVQHKNSHVYLDPYGFLSSLSGVKFASTMLERLFRVRGTCLDPQHV